MPERLFAHRASLPLAVALAALIVYWRTLLPDVSAWGDSAKFQYLAQVWGIPHPTGYPVYLLLTRLFALLPWGTLAYRVNLLSAVCAAAAIGVLTLIAFQMSRDRASAAGAALMVAFSPLFWSQAVVAEVYALNALWVALCLALILRWRASGRPADLYIALLVYGLSFSHHMSMVLLLPAFLYWIACKEASILLRPHTWLVIAAAIGLGLLPYTYILVRAAQGASYSEFPTLGERSLLAAWVDYLSGAQFRGGFLAVFGQGPDALWSRVALYGRLLAEQFAWWGVALAGLGSVVLWRRRERVLLVGLVLAFLTQLVFSLGYDVIDPEVYFIPSYLVCSLLIASGLGGLGQLIRRAGGARLRLVSNGLWVGLCLALPGLSLLGNWCAVDQSDNLTARRWAEALLRGLQPNAAIVMPQPYYYSQKQVLQYVMVAERGNLDLQFIEPSQVDAWFGRRPVYLLEPLAEIAERYRLQAIDSSEETLDSWLARLPEGTIVLAAAKDEASLRLSDRAARAWQLVGGQFNLQGCFRCAHALVGVRGAPPGTALEAGGAGLRTLDLPAGALIGNTGQRTPVRITLRSAGLEAGNLGDIWLGGCQVSPQHRGYNIVALAPSSGQLLAAVYADTFESDRVNNVRSYRVLARR